jgi:hypothetical protein
MKKPMRAFYLAAILIAFLFMGCSNKNSQLVGTWKCHLPGLTKQFSTDLTYVFNADGTYQTNMGGGLQEGKYSFDGQTLTTRLSGEVGAALGAAGIGKTPLALISANEFIEGANPMTSNKFTRLSQKDADAALVRDVEATLNAK